MLSADFLKLARPLLPVLLSMLGALAVQSFVLQYRHDQQLLIIKNEYKHLLEYHKRADITHGQVQKNHVRISILEDKD